MNGIICSRCGANEWESRNGYRVCKFCGTVFQLESSDFSIKESNISVNSDVIELLKKCKAEPHKARIYANLILDIDPSNTEALKYL